MAITDKEEGVWSLDEVYNKQNEGDIWTYSSNLFKFKTTGSNSAGTLALNDTTLRSSPTQVGTDTTWSAIMSGSYSYNQMMARKSDSTLWTWGSNGGQLGLNDTTFRSSPTQLPGTDWSGFFSYGMRTAMASKNGQMWVWGSNQMGQLGQNEHGPAPSNQSSPIQIPGAWTDGIAGDYAMFGIKGGGLYAWGGVYNSSLGLNQGYGNDRSSPTQVGTDTTWAKTAKGAYRMNAAIKTDGTLWAWGTGSAQVAGASPTGKRSSPIQVPGTTWSEVATTVQETLYAIKTDGTLWAAGGSNESNQVGQLGQNSTTNSETPIQIPGTWASVHPYGQSCAAIKTDGTLWVWGSGTNGRIGLNDTVQYSSPTQIPGVYNTEGNGAGATHTGILGMLEAL